MTLLHPKFNISEPRFDQGTYWGRAKHFFVTTNPVNILATQEQLEEAKDLLDKFKKGEIKNISEDELWKAKQLYLGSHSIWAFTFKNQHKILR